MLARLLESMLDLERVGPLVGPPTVYLRTAWPGWLALLVILSGFATALFFYSRETSLTSSQRTWLGVLRGIVYALILTLLFEPALAIEMTVKVRRNILVLIDGSESMELKDKRRTHSEIEEAALATGEIKFSDIKPEGSKALLSQSFTDKASSFTRLHLVKGVLTNTELNLIGELQDDYRVEFFKLGGRAEPISVEGKELSQALAQVSADLKATAIGTGVDEVVSRYGGEAVAGVIILTDGASNQGQDTLEVAHRMREKNIPIYPIGFGLPNPRDLRLENLVVQEVVFKDDEVLARVQVLAPGFADREVEAVLKLDGNEVASLPVVLTDAPQWIEIPFIADKGGTFRLDISIAPLPEETVKENNTIGQTIRVIDEQIKVLYIEGKPRWEFRYLRQVLRRDHRLDVKFIMTEGDADLAKYSREYLTRFPTDAAGAFRFDLVIVGDVRSSFFQPEELTRIEELIRTRGGSFLMIAGNSYSPGDYEGTIIENMLPIRLAGGKRAVSQEVYPVLTTAGKLSSVVRIEGDEEQSVEIWKRVRPLFSVPAVNDVKPGAMVLIGLSGSESDRSYPLMAWHRYGTGKSLFLATDQLWRLRFKTGDRYHARFWGQTIQFLTLSRLLGENRQISIQTDHKEYRTGQAVRIYANVLDETYTPVKAEEYTVYLKLKGSLELTKAVALDAVPESEGLFQGYAEVEKEGRYELKAGRHEEAVSNLVEFDVRTQSLEQLQPALQLESLRKFGEISGGKYFAIHDLAKLRKTIGGEEKTTVVKREKELWDLWIVLVVIVLCTGTEWFVRRRLNLM
ncbi:MAG: VWA domain-containing protein [Planctomycetota bacterium]|nr:VWA domain-containing protein [Planctomycetota bacterium]MDA1137202.1 VWA domain-containing protein [Planctomycetota bacterium]